ncbi:MAG: hypothetical protein OEZ58_24240 [Gammaproteobacteria bacterium]|nr:hypothetical protein [Gammaproteobacteria bacterium]
MSEPSCACPEVVPEWHGLDLDLSNQCVHDQSIPSFFHMPISYDLYRQKQAQNIEHLELKERWPGLVLTRTGLWGGQILRLLEAAESPSRQVRFLETPFYVSVFLHEGGIGTAPKAAQLQQLKMSERKLKPKELFLAHLTCPICSEAKGGDKILIIRRWMTKDSLPALTRP